MRKTCIVLLLAAFAVGAAEVEIDITQHVNPTCSAADGSVISNHQRYDKAQESCLNEAAKNPGVEYYAIGQASRISVTVTETNPDPDPDPDPVPDPDPSPDPDPQPSTYRDIPDPSQALGFDVYADYQADKVLSGDQSQLAVTQSGTASDPYVVDMNGFTVGALGVSGSYVIVQNGNVRTTGEGPVRSQGSRVVFRDIDVGGNNTNHGHGAAITLGNHSVWLRGEVHNFGILGADAPEQDQHGFKICGPSDVWILDVETYELSGDGVQVGDASRCTSNRVYIGGGYYHDNRENAVDIKDSTGVVVSGVRMANFAPTNSSPGEAVIVHDDAYNAKIVGNTITNSRLGIVSSGRSGHLIDGNTIQANSIGIQLRNTRPITVINNDITAPQKVQCQGGLNSGDTIEGC